MNYECVIINLAGKVVTFAFNKFYCSNLKT